MHIRIRACIRGGHDARGGEAALRQRPAPEEEAAGSDTTIMSLWLFTFMEMFNIIINDITPEEAAAGSDSNTTTITKNSLDLI